MLKKILLTLTLLFPILCGGQGMPSEQFVLYKVWADDSTALKNLGCGDYIFSEKDTVILEGSDTDTVLFQISNPRGYFSLWVTGDTANFTIDGISHNHSLGASDSLSVSYRPKTGADTSVGNPATALNYIKNLDWDVEKTYYETITPPLAEYLEFYIAHTGTGDTSAVIIELLRQ